MWDSKQLEYICVILRWYMCPQLACCLLNTELGPSVIHTLQPSHVLSQYSTLSYSFVSICCLLFLLFRYLSIPVFILVPALPCLYLFSPSLKASWPPCSTRNLILKCPVPFCQQELWKGRK